MRRMSFMPDLARFLGILVACLLWLASAGAQSSAPAESVSDIEIEAHLSSAGPYGENRYLHITRNGTGYLRFFNSSPSGSMTGAFFVDVKRLTAMRAVARDAAFEKLPEAIQPNVMRMHAPSYILTMYDGSKRHKVWLYEPENPPSANPGMAAPDARR